MESAQAERTEVDIPFAVVDLDEPDGFLAQGLADVDPLLVPADAAVAAHPADLVVTGILQGREAGRIEPRGRRVHRGRGAVGEGLVRTERVVLLTPVIEAALLLGPGALGWAGALALEGEVHALVAAVSAAGRRAR